MKATKKQKVQQKLASQICRLEGKKSQVKIGDAREVLKIFRELILANDPVAVEFLVLISKDLAEGK